MVPAQKRTNQAKDTSGSTGVVALITPTHALVANAGDSRSILVKASTRRGHDVQAEGGVVKEVSVFPMSIDHTANRVQERERVTAAGGIAFDCRHKLEDGKILEVSDQSSLGMVIEPHLDIVGLKPYILSMEVV